MDGHLTDLELAAYLEGRLEPWQRRRAERHLAACPVCTEAVGKTFRLLRESGELPPPALYHPLEQWLRELGRWLPWPPWAWHAVLSGLIPLLWWLLGLPAQVPWLQDFRYQVIAWLGSWVLTTYFIYLQSRLRRFHDLLWRAGVPLAQIETFQTRYLAPLQGWLRFPWPGKGRRHLVLPAGGTLLVAALLMEGLNQCVQSGPRYTLPDIAARLIGFYMMLATTATAWGGLWGARYFVGLGQFLWQQPLPAEAREPVREAVRQIVHHSIIVAGVCVTWAVGWSVRQAGFWPHPWVEMHSAVLLVHRGLNPSAV